MSVKVKSNPLSKKLISAPLVVVTCSAHGCRSEAHVFLPEINHDLYRKPDNRGIEEAVFMMRWTVTDEAILCPDCTPACCDKTLDMFSGGTGCAPHSDNPTTVSSPDNEDQTTQ